MNLRIFAPSETGKLTLFSTQPSVSLRKLGTLGPGETFWRSALMNSIMMRASNQACLPSFSPVMRWRKATSIASTPSGMLISR